MTDEERVTVAELRNAVRRGNGVVMTDEELAHVVPLVHEMRAALSALDGLSIDPFMRPQVRPTLDVDPT